ncbi:MAG: hypothetical protein J6J79_01430 [Lachnospiraceae bacterium]|nr:hypothetical protein [Lachnospiraceae bacterium]
MKLCIVKPDNAILEVLTSEHQPSIETVNNELLFFENYQYKLIVRDDKRYESVELFVGDYAIPLHYNTVIDCYETEASFIFEGCFDLACISVYVNDEYGEENVFFTDFFRIATTKQTAKRVEQMLEEIEEKLPNFLDVCFSKNRKKSGLIKNDIRSIWNTLKIVDEIIHIYEENYGYFNNQKKTSVEPVAAIMDARSMRTIDQESLRWIACNPDNLIWTNKDTGLIIKEKNYMPSKVKTYISQYSYDVYENKVVLGFLKNVIDYLDNQISGFNKEIAELKNIPDTIVVQLPNTHELTGRCVYIYYKGVIERFYDRRDTLKEIFSKYRRIMECSPLEVYSLPRFSNTFKQIYHYRLCYECMIKWFEAGDYTLDHLNYLFKLKTLSRIFEYYCLIKIQNAIKQCGYVLQETNRIVYDEEDTEDINNQYIFNGNGYEMVLLYEPSIWVNKVNDGINLYSTGYNFLKGKWNKKWKPDFVLKISCNNREYYYILDAKYSNTNNVKKRHLPELVLKYSTQIASKDKFFPDVIGVGAMYPGDEDKSNLFKRNVIGSKAISLPEYFAFTIVGEKVGDNILKEKIIELLKTVDAIELKREENKVHSIVIEEVQKDGLVFNDKLAETSIIIDIEDSNDIEVKKLDLLENVSNEYQKHIMVGGNGKKCFYYGKSLCLLKRTRCDVGEKNCEYYISKSTKKLFIEEDTCRNFIHYIRRGKVSRVECSVSGLPGCVGIENCKFYMKKNKSKTNQ